MIDTANDCRFDEATHTYWRGLVQLPSVTQIITSVWPRTDNAPADAIEQARLRGEWVDAHFTEYLMTGSTLAPAGTPEKWTDSLGVAIDWWERERKGAKVECQVQLFGYHEAGKADLIVNDCEILELKSTWEISKTVGAQLGGYSSLRSESLPIEFAAVDYKLGVLHAHYRFKKAQFKPINYELAHQEWLTCRNFWRLINGK